MFGFDDDMYARSVGRWASHTYLWAICGVSVGHLWITVDNCGASVGHLWITVDNLCVIFSASIVVMD